MIVKSDRFTVASFAAMLATMNPTWSLGQNARSPDPNRIRPPLALSDTGSFRLITHAWASELLSALTRRDSVSLSLLAPPSIVPEAELHSASAEGCSDVSKMVGRLSNPDALNLAQISIASMTSSSDTSVLGQASLRLAVPIPHPRAYLIEVTFESRGADAHPSLVAGLVQAVCAIAAQ